MLYSLHYYNKIVCFLLDFKAQKQNKRSILLYHDLQQPSIYIWFYLIIYIFPIQIKCMKILRNFKFSSRTINNASYFIICNETRKLLIENNSYIKCSCVSNENSITNFLSIIYTDFLHLLRNLNYKLKWITINKFVID